MQQLQHNRNEKQEVEFFQDKQYTISFDFYNKNAEDLYIDGLNGDITPLIAMEDKIRRTAKVYTPYIPQNQKPLYYVKTLNDITPNLSKYIPEDNAVLFLSQDNNNEYYKYFLNCKQCVWTKSSPIIYYDENKLIQEEWIVNRFHNDKDITTKPITIFLPHGTQSEIQKAKEVAKELMEKYGVEEVNLCVLHCFVKYAPLKDNEYYINDNGVYTKYSFDKIITTNSTGILKPEDSNERLQVIDCKEIFEEYLRNN